MVGQFLEFANYKINKSQATFYNSIVTFKSFLVRLDILLIAYVFVIACQVLENVVLQDLNKKKKKTVVLRLSIRFFTCNNYK